MTDPTRRDLLKRGVLGAAAAALPGGIRLLAEPPPARTPALGERSGSKCRADTVIQIWMWGGPCHIDTFDPKPEAGREYCGPLDAPIATNVDGIRIGQNLPRLAKLADKYSIVRSLSHGVNSHETASYLVQTGHETGQLVYPAAGAVASLFRGYDHGYQGIVPPYVVLTTPQGRFSEEGFLGQRCKPFATGGDPNGKVFAVEGIVAEDISDERQNARRDLLRKIDGLGSLPAGDPRLAPHEKSGEKAYDLMFGDLREVFDLAKEKDETRERYGRNTFGQSCLMARRLAERGVPWITVNYQGWDTHKRHFETMQRKLPEMDQGMAALLEELHGLGLLNRTVVWWSGEFGRTPKVQWDAPWNGGRGHHGACFSAVVAGGGFKGGHVVGASDAKGMEPADRPVSPRDLLASIFDRLGIDPDGPLPNAKGMDLRVLPGEKDGRGGGILREILA